MRICSSVGRVTFAVPLLATAVISLLLLLEVVEHEIQLVEPLGPRALVVLDPVVDGLERASVEPVQPLPSFVTHINRPHCSKHPQVLGHLRLGEPEHAHQVVHGPLATGEDIEDLPPPGLGHRIERVCCGRCSCHYRIVYPYRHMSSSAFGGEVCLWLQISERSRRRGVGRRRRCRRPERRRGPRWWPRG